MAQPLFTNTSGLAGKYLFPLIFEEIMNPYRANGTVAYLFRSRRITCLRIIRIYPKTKIVDILFTSEPRQEGRT